MRIATCIGCGCTDTEACIPAPGELPCHWLVVDRKAGLGVCSNCPDDLARWNAGDRKVAAVLRVAKFVKHGGDGTPYYIERTAMEAMPLDLSSEAGDTYTMTWEDMPVDVFRALPQFEHVHLADQWENLIAQAKAAELRGDADAAARYRADALPFEQRLAALGIDIRDQVPEDLITPRDIEPE